MNPALQVLGKIFTKRRLLVCLATIPLLILIDACCIELTWLLTRTVSLSPQPSIRIVHVSDFHYVGNRDYLDNVVTAINRAEPDVVCMTGDYLEDNTHLQEFMLALSQIDAPIIAVRGNHEDWHDIDVEPIRKLCQSNGGAWLEQGEFVFEGVRFFGAGQIESIEALKGTGQKVLLCHYPGAVDKLPEGTHYDLVLAGHTHGGQVRIPGYGALIIPYASGSYQVGMYETKAGQLHVSPGIGTYFFNVRFFCRPEVTVFEL